MIGYKATDMDGCCRGFKEEGVNYEGRRTVRCDKAAYYYIR